MMFHSKSFKLGLVGVFALAIMIAALVALSPIAGVANAQEITVTVPSITGTTTIQPSQNYTLTASGFGANETVELLFDNTRLSIGQADGSGGYAAGVKIPGNVPDGNYSLKAKAGNVEASYTADLDPILSTSISQGGVGNTMVIDGAGWAASEVVTLTFQDVITCNGSGSTNESLGTATAARTGQVHKSSTIPSVNAGSYYVCGTGATSGETTTY